MKAALRLRLALMANAIFSLSSALLMLFFPAVVGEWLGIQAPLILQVVGIGLVAFAAELIYQATRQRVATWRALIASAADFSWVASSIVLLLAFPQLFSPLGNALVLAVAGTVFVFGAWQLWAAGHAHRIEKSGEYRHCIIVETNAPAEKMWRVVGDIGDIKNYMPSLKHSVILDGKIPGVGAVRACEDHAGKQWSEECTAFNPGHSFAVRFLSEAPNFPFPAKTMRGGWEVTPSNGGSRVMVWWELTPKSKLLAPVILPLLAFQADRDFPKIIQRMTAAVLGKNGAGQMQSNGAVFVRLLPTFC
ncbi:SRPBCC family protein [candidate division KSB1 bacterium]|nr:SRPBCC family protein [candidate division KSB1 bacterium]